MRIIRKSEQTTVNRSGGNREVRSIFSEPVHLCDWLVVTHSQRQIKDVAHVAVGFHSHPSALELILFQKSRSLDINGVRHDFMPEDAIILESDDIHGAEDLREHDCICILLGKGKPQKMSLE